MKLEKYQPEKTHAGPTPEHMAIGQIVTRQNPKRAAVAHLRFMMRKAMTKKMEFSHGWDGKNYVIRRDK
jgi:hypothetical protein